MGRLRKHIQTLLPTCLMSHNKHSAVQLFGMVFLFFLAFPEAANAAWQSLSCTNGTPTNNSSLYDVSGICPGTGIFTILSCNFQQILVSVLSKMYCGIQYKIAPALMAAITLFVIIFGIMMLLGMLQLSLREFALRVLKIALVWSFATNSAYAIDLGFRLFMGAINQGMVWVLSIASAPYGCSSAYAMQTLDCLIYNKLVGPFTDTGAKLIAFFSALTIALPPIFLFFLFVVIKSTVVLVRALITYLLGISAIAFLIALGPIFVSFALFKVTYSFFDSWLRYMISFALQIVLIFTSISLLFLVMNQFSSTFFDSLTGIIANYNRTWWMGPNRQELTAIAVCPSQMTVGPYGPTLVCTSTAYEDMLPPSAWIFQTGLLYSLILNLATLGIIVYLFDTLNKNIPDIARQLSGPAFAPMIGGGQGSGFGAVNFPGGGVMGAASQGFSSAFSSSQGGLFSKILGGASGSGRAIRQSITGGRAERDAGAVANFKKQQSDLSSKRQNV